MTDELAPRRFHIGAQPHDAPALPPGLYLVATPIGNLGDITIRALETLAAADVVYCEDTRITLRLLQRYGLRVPLKALHDHNEAELAPHLAGQIAGGAAVALVSDAGTPLVSDPGYRLVKACANGCGRHGAARGQRGADCTATLRPRHGLLPLCRLPAHGRWRTRPRAG